MSTRWWGTRACSAALGLAVPMSMPLVDLPAVGADDLAVKARRQVEAERGLADGRRALDYDQGRLRLLPGLLIR